MSNTTEILYDQAQKDLSFDRDNLDDAWSEQPLLFAKYAYKLSELEETAAKFKNQLDEESAKLYNLEKKELLLDGIKPTESTLTNKIKSNPSYVRIKNAYDRARNDVEFCKHILEALKQRRDMIVQASKREQFDIERLGESSFIKRK